MIVLPTFLIKIPIIKDTTYDFYTYICDVVIRKDRWGAVKKTKSLRLRVKHIKSRVMKKGNFFANCVFAVSVIFTVLLCAEKNVCRKHAPVHDFVPPPLCSQNLWTSGYRLRHNIFLAAACSKNCPDIRCRNSFFGKRFHFYYRYLLNRSEKVNRTVCGKFSVNV